MIAPYTCLCRQQEKSRYLGISGCCSDVSLPQSLYRNTSAEAKTGRSETVLRFGQSTFVGVSASRAKWATSANVKEQECTRGSVDQLLFEACRWVQTRIVMRALRGGSCSSSYLRFNLTSESKPAQATSAENDLPTDSTSPPPHHGHDHNLLPKAAPLTAPQPLAEPFPFACRAMMLTMCAESNSMQSLCAGWTEWEPFIRRSNSCATSRLNRNRARMSSLDARARKHNLLLMRAGSLEMMRRST